MEVKDSYRDEEEDGEVLHPRTGDRRCLEASERHRTKGLKNPPEEILDYSSGDTGKVKFRKDTQMLSHPYAGEQFVGVPTWSRDKEVETLSIPLPSAKEKAEGKTGEESKSSRGGSK